MRAKDFILKETGAPKRGDNDPIGDLANKLLGKSNPVNSPTSQPNKSKRPPGTPPIHIALEPTGLGAYIESKAKADGIKGTQLANFMAQSRVETARFTTLEEVINHYSEGLQNSPTIDPLMKKVSQGGVQLTEEEKTDLKAFLLSLSDEAFISNPAFLN